MAKVNVVEISNKMKETGNQHPYWGLKDTKGWLSRYPIDLCEVPVEWAREYLASGGKFDIQGVWGVPPCSLYNGLRFWEYIAPHAAATIPQREGWRPRWDNLLDDIREIALEGLYIEATASYKDLQTLLRGVRRSKTVRLVGAKPKAYMSLGHMAREVFAQHLLRTSTRLGLLGKSGWRILLGESEELWASPLKEKEWAELLSQSPRISRSAEKYVLSQIKGAVRQRRTTVRGEGFITLPSCGKNFKPMIPTHSLRAMDWFMANWDRVATPTGGDTPNRFPGKWYTSHYVVHGFVGDYHYPHKSGYLLLLGTRGLFKTHCGESSVVYLHKVRGNTVFAHPAGGYVTVTGSNYLGNITWDSLTWVEKLRDL